MKIRLLVSLIFATMFLLVWISMPSPVAGAPENICDLANLPLPVQELLKNKFPLMRPRQMSDLGADDRKLWLRTHAKDCPGTAIGHFDSKDQLAYAFLLVAKSNPAAGYKLGVFSKEANADTYSWKLLNQVEGGKDQIDSTGLVISKVPPGKYSNFQNTRTIHTTLDSIALEWMEAGADLFYWSGGRYQKLSVSE